MRATRSKDMGFSVNQDPLALQDGIVISKMVVG
jgi:hypothetical protein